MSQTFYFEPFKTMMMILLALCSILQITLATNNTVFHIQHKDVMQHVASFMDPRSVSNALRVNQAWNTEIKQVSNASRAQLDELWINFQHEAKQYIFKTSVLQKDYLFCVLADIQMVDQLAFHNQDDSNEDDAFWNTAYLMKQMSPKHPQHVQVVQQLMNQDSDLNKQFVQAAKIKSCLESLSREFPIRRFEAVHDAICTLWTMMRVLLLDEFYRGVNNDTVIDGFNLGLCKRGFQWQITHLVLNDTTKRYKGVWAFIGGIFDEQKFSDAKNSLVSVKRENTSKRWTFQWLFDYLTQWMTAMTRLAVERGGLHKSILRLGPQHELRKNRTQIL